MFDGILIIDKPAVLTSHDVVSRLRRILSTKKIGHTGTLDPFATGVLVMLVGKATRLAQFLDKDAKQYEAIVRFGFETDTGDVTGRRRGEEETGRQGDRETGRQGDNLKFEISYLESVLADFRGEIEQTPPMYSAKKVKGKKLYELARQGIEIERQPVRVSIYELELLDTSEIRNPKSEIRIRVACSAGTYIRTLAEDIGKKIGVGAHLAALRRTRAGNFDLAKAVTIEELEKIVEENNLDKISVSMNEAVAHLPEKRLDPDELKQVKNGLKINASFAEESVHNVRLTDGCANLIAIGTYRKEENRIQPRIVFL